MGQLRIRWGWLARGAGVLAGGLLALQVLPGLLAPPEAPPLAADVGLPRVIPIDGRKAVPPERAIGAAERQPGKAPEPVPPDGVSAATAVIGSTPRRYREGSHRGGRRREQNEVRARPPRPAPPPATPPTPPPATPAPGPEPAPPEPARAPEDGSLEFAPR
jgi:hypothetical protein